MAFVAEYQCIAMTILFCTILTGGYTVPNMAEIRGDVMVAGLFSIQENKNGICSNIDLQSVMNFEAIRWYFENLNSSASLPFRIGLLAYKTCGIMGKATESMVDIISRSRTARDSNGVNHTYIIGVIGPELNSEAEVVSYGISSLHPDDRLLQIGFSTTAGDLGDSRLYPNFHRVIPNDRTGVKVMVKAFEKLGWTRFAIVYESSKYATESAYALKNAVEEIGICVSYFNVINVTSSGDVNLNEISTVVEDIAIRSSPLINGVVFFGTASTAQLIMIKANSNPIASLPLFFMSEGIGLNTKVFYDGNVFIWKALGSYAVSSPFKKVTEFHTYWTSLFRNTSKLLEKSQSNPWLLDAFEKVSKCRPSSVSSCNGLTDIQIANASITYSVYTRYALLAAHTMSRTLLSVIKSSCDGSAQICPTFLDSFKPMMMSKDLESITFDTDKDFGWKVPSLSDQFLLNSSGEVVFLSDAPIFELYNLQKGNKTSNIVDFERIGTFKDGDLTLKTETIRDYDKDQKELVWPNIRRAECLNGYICRECIASTIPDLMIHLSGDLYVVAMLPVHDKNGALGCDGIRVIDGYQLIEAFKYAVDKFNTGGEYSSSFGRNIRIGLIVLNSCNSGLVVKRKILEIHSKGVTKGSNTIDINKRVIGYVGELGSSVSIASSQVLSQLGYVQVSYASTSSLLSSRNDFPYFMRVVTPDNKQADVMVELIKQLNSEYVQLIYSEETYGIGGRDSLLAATKGKQVCIVQPPISLKDSNDENFSGFYERLRQNPQAKIVIVFLRSHLAVFLMNTLSSQMKKGEFIFIGSEAWGKSVDIVKKGTPANLIGSFTVAMEMSSKEILVNTIKGMFPERNGSTPWMQAYLENKLSCYFNWSYNRAQSTLCTQDKIKELLPDGWVMFATNAALSLLIGASKFFTTKCSTWTGVLCDNYISNASGLVQEIKNVALDLQGSGIPVKVFDSNGDGNIGYTIYNIQQTGTDINYVKVGQYLLDAGITLVTSNLQYPNGVPVASPCPNTQACEACFSDGPSSQTEASKQSDAAMPVLGALVGLFGAATIGLILGIIFCRRRGHANNATYLTATYEAPQRTDNPSGSDFPSDDRFTHPGSCSVGPPQSKI
ncbi:hypothetical protein ACJMK2_025118 [Sinanodonta woodiana]|uniref:Receptor ligand binding region domain-containing protein n=1 Tax=Sinanodonta woodiana TaxID=1069815 RepID=A0ABD3XFH8_SINWO